MAVPATQAPAAVAANIPITGPPLPAQQVVPPLPAQVAYALVLGSVVVVNSPLLTEKETIHQILHWIGFDTYTMKTDLINESIGNLDYVLSLNQKDVLSFSTDWSSRTEKTSI